MISRKITPLEYLLSLKIFKHSINYNKVRIHNERYVFFQPANSGMTPNGEIYLNGAYKEDFGLERPATQAFFIHEMTHVWQYQNHILNPIVSATFETLSHLFDYSEAYKYTLDETKDLRDYKIDKRALLRTIIEPSF